MAKWRRYIYLESFEKIIFGRYYVIFFRKKISNQSDGFREMKHLEELSTCFFSTFLELLVINIF